MDINELFDKIQKKFDEDELRGEFILQEGLIIWSFNLCDDVDEFDYIEEDNEEYIFNYEGECSEEILIEAYHEDVEKTKLFLDEIEEVDNWTLTDYEIVDDVILFKVF